MARKTIKVDYLARVEGEGALKVVVRDGKVQSMKVGALTKGQLKTFVEEAV